MPRWLTIQLDPALLLPPGTTGHFTFNQGLSVGFLNTTARDPYPGNGVITVSSNSQGYGFVDLYVPTSEHALATTILNSSDFSLATTLPSG